MTTLNLRQYQRMTLHVTREACSVLKERFQISTPTSIPRRTKPIWVNLALRLRGEIGAPSRGSLLGIIGMKCRARSDGKLLLKLYVIIPKCSYIFRTHIMTGQHGTKRPGTSWAEFYRKNEAGMTPMIRDTHVLLVNQIIVVAILKLSKKYLPGSRRGNQSQRGPSSWRN